MQYRVRVLFVYAALLFVLFCVENRRNLAGFPWLGNPGRHVAKDQAALAIGVVSGMSPDQSVARDDVVVKDNDHVELRLLDSPLPRRRITRILLEDGSNSRFDARPLLQHLERTVTAAVDHDDHFTRIGVVQCRSQNLSEPLPPVESGNDDTDQAAMKTRFSARFFFLLPQCH